MAPTSIYVPGVPSIGKRGRRVRVVGGGAPTGMRMVPNNANSFYVMASNDRGTAFAYQFIRNVGGNAATDTGTNYQPWRKSSVLEFASINNNPLVDTPIRTWCSDTGAFNYAVSMPNGLWAGSYHGGEVVNTMTVKLNGATVDPTVSTATGTSFRLDYTSTVTSGGATYNVDFTHVLNADGSDTQTVNSLTSTASFGRWYIGMMIASGAYPEGWATISGTQYKVPVLVGTSTYGRTYLQKAGTVRLFQPATGNTIRSVSNAPSLGAYRRTSIVRDTGLNRSKLYMEFNTGVPSGITAVSWTTYYELGVALATTFGSNLITNGDFPTNITGWTSTHNPSGVSWNAGKLRQLRGASGTETRTLQGVTMAAVPHLLAAENTYTPAAGTAYVNPGALGLTNASNGSTSTPTPDYVPIQGDANGYAAHVVIPSSAGTRYAMLLHTAAGAAGTQAGDISDWDNVSLIQLST